MIEQEFSQEIKAPVEKTFAFISDFQNVSKWQSGVSEFSQTPDGPTQVGTRVNTVRTLLGQRMEITAEVLELIPNQKLAIKTISGPIQLHLVHILTPVPGGTKVDVHLELEGGGFFKLAEGALAANMRKEFEAQTQKMKELLEAN